MTPSDDRLRVATNAARAAGELLLRFREGGVQAELKGRIDLVSEADRAAEALIREHLDQAAPGDLIVGEEGEELTEQDVAGRSRWYVDPLDGTTNYLHGGDHWGVSLGWCSPSGALELGVVYVPASGELFCAVTGGGAWLSSATDDPAGTTRIRVTEVGRLEEALVASGFPYDLEHGPTNLPQWAAVTLRARSVRCLGAAALELCEVARGHLDGFWEQRLARWDTAAGLVIAAEAGARLSNLHGEALHGPSQDVVVAGRRLLPQLLKVLADA